MKLHTEKGFTLTELLVVVGVFVLMTAMFLPAQTSNARKASGIVCTDNLRQVGVAYRVFSEDNGGAYPQAVPAVQGGAYENVGHGTTTIVTRMNPTAVFMVMSNELSNPKVVYCPSDNFAVEPALAFNYSGSATPIFGPCMYVSVGTSAGFQAQTGNGCSSYFVNGDASGVDPRMIVGGDRNIGSVGTSGSAGAASTAAFIVGGSTTVSTPTMSYASYFGVTAMTPFFGSAYWSWTANDMHQKSGNLLMADGSAKTVSVSGLHEAMRNSTNGVSAQAWNFPR